MRRRGAALGRRLGDTGRGGSGGHIARGTPSPQVVGQVVLALGIGAHQPQRVGVAGGQQPEIEVDIPVPELAVAAAKVVLRGGRERVVRSQVVQVAAEFPAARVGGFDDHLQPFADEDRDRLVSGRRGGVQSSRSGKRGAGGGKAAEKTRVRLVHQYGSCTAGEQKTAIRRGGRGRNPFKKRGATAAIPRLFLGTTRCRPDDTPRPALDPLNRTPSGRAAAVSILKRYE